MEKWFGAMPRLKNALGYPVDSFGKYGHFSLWKGGEGSPSKPYSVNFAEKHARSCSFGGEPLAKIQEEPAENILFSLLSTGHGKTNMDLQKKAGSGFPVFVLILEKGYQQKCGQKTNKKRPLIFG